jgi:hypothetical protein
MYYWNLIKIVRSVLEKISMLCFYVHLKEAHFWSWNVYAPWTDKLLYTEYEQNLPTIQPLESCITVHPDGVSNVAFL